MRKFFLLAALSNPCYGAIAVINHVQCAGGGSCTTAAKDMTGSALIVLCQKTAAAAAPTVSDSAGNSWTALTAIQSGSGNPWVQIFYKAGPAVSATQTFTTGTGGSVFGLSAIGFSGITTTLPFDQQNGAGGGPITTKQPGSITPTVDGELLYSCLGGTMNDLGSTIDNAFAITDTSAYDGTTTYGGGVAWKTQTTAAAINPTWTFSSASASATIASFKAGASFPFGIINNPVPGGI